MPEEQPTSTHFDFGVALQNLKGGNKVTREGWNGPKQYLTLIPAPTEMMEKPSDGPFDGADISLPYIAIRTVQGDLVPWLASQTDMLATDWELA